MTKDELVARIQKTVDRIKDPALRGQTIRIFSNGSPVKSGVFLGDEIVNCKSVKWECSVDEPGISRVTLELGGVPLAMEGIIVDIIVKDPNYIQAERDFNKSQEELDQVFRSRLKGKYAS